MSKGDIVFEIGADIAGLTSGGKAGERSLGQMERSARQLEGQIRRMGAAGAAFQRDINALTGVNAKMARSARDAADAFQEFDRSRAAVDSLRASVDPLFAASKRYEAALVQLDAALEMGTISAREHSQMVQLLGQSYISAGDQAQVMTGRFAALGNMSGRARSQLQGVGYQVQDFAVQVGAGTSAVQALGQQLPQLASGFGPVGVAVGVLAAVSLPLLGAAFSSSGSEAGSLKARLDELGASVDAINNITRTYSAEGISELIAKYGEVNAELLGVIETQRQFSINVAIESANAAVDKLAESYGALLASMDNLGRFGTLGIRQVKLELGLTESQARELQSALKAASEAVGFDQQAAALARVSAVLAQSKIKTGELAEAINRAYFSLKELAAAAPKASWMNAAISGVTALGGEIRARLREAMALAAAASVDATGAAVADGLPEGARRAPPRAPSGIGGIDWGAPVAGAGGGGGGGGGADPRQARLLALVESLKTESEVVAEWYAQSLEALNMASAAELEALGGKHSAIQRLEQEHQERLSQIKEAGNQWGLQAALEGGAEILGAMSSTNAKAAKAQAIFASGAALMSTYQGAAAELEKGTFGFASAAAVIAKGIGFVGAIMRAGSGGGGGGAVSAAGASGAAAPAPPPTIANINWYGPMDANSFRSLTRQLNAEHRRGYTMNFREMG